jgi:hypothetical protein
MALTCSRCSRVNPPDAVYCYFDGIVLSGQTNAGPVNMGTKPFPTPFVFPSGRACQNFDQLALACHEEDKAAVELLQQGDFAAFLSGMGRSDLAKLAREAAKEADINRGLDDFISKLPSHILQAPKLAVEPSEINLGTLKTGEDRKLTITLVNKGMRLLYGSIRTKEVWLGLGEGAGAQQKLFEFKSDLTIPVQIHGKRLMCRPKPYEVKLNVESNGGNIEVIVRFSVPVQPFPDGVLAGAISPRQIAEKAKAKPKEAAVFFENGTVARWYKENGWDYPVKGPATSGLAAIQQYYEAHGLARAPRVEISQKQIALQGTPGEQVRATLEVRTVEKRSVYALAQSSHPWLAIESTPPRGPIASVVMVATVPDRPGETLQAKVAIQANGNQKFLVPVTLTVGNGHGKRGGAAAPVREAAAVEAMAVTPSPKPALRTATLVDDDDDDDSPRFRRKRRGSPLLHLSFAFLLLFPLFGIFVHDVLLSPEDKQPEIITQPPPEEKPDPTPRVALRFQDARDEEHSYPDKIERDLRLGATMRFGLLMTQVPDPRYPARFKQLNYVIRQGKKAWECGLTNNTCVRVDGNEQLFGQLPGHWVKARVNLEPENGRQRDGCKSVWTLDDRVIITQFVEVVRGQTNLLDTCLVRYVIENKDNRPHNVGLRFMLDTYIGSNDGVPFTIPNHKGLCDTLYDFKTPQEVPDFIQALEHPDIASPGTIAQVQFKVSSDIEPPSRVTLGAWPDGNIGEALYGAVNARDPRKSPYQQFLTKWDVPLITMKKMTELAVGNSADSCVVMYWPEAMLNAGATRVVGFSYGLGAVGSNKEGQLGLTVGGSLTLNGEFSITAYVTNPAPGQTVTLHLPKALLLREGEAKQVVPAVPDGSARPISTVTWKVHALEAGSHEIQVESSGGTKASIKLFIKHSGTKGIFD